jgi:hypothetical protein
MAEKQNSAEEDTTHEEAATAVTDGAERRQHLHAVVAKRHPHLSDAVSHAAVTRLESRLDYTKSKSQRSFAWGEEVRLAVFAASACAGEPLDGDPKERMPRPFSKASDISAPDADRFDKIRELPTLAERRARVVTTLAAARRDLASRRAPDGSGGDPDFERARAAAVGEREEDTLSRVHRDLRACHSLFANLSAESLVDLLDNPRLALTEVAARLSLECGAFGDVYGDGESGSAALVRVQAEYDEGKG